MRVAPGVGRGGQWALGIYRGSKGFMEVVSKDSIQLPQATLKREENSAKGQNTVAPIVCTHARGDHKKAQNERSTA